MKQVQGTPRLMDIFLRDKPLSVTEWVEVLESTRARIEPFLDSVTLPRLGDHLLYGEDSESEFGGLHRLRKDEPRFNIGPGVRDLNLDSQGFFFEAGSQVNHQREEGILFFWSLLRNGSWVSFLIVCEIKSSGELLRKYFKAKVVSVGTPQSTEEVVRYYLDHSKPPSPEYMLKDLSNAVHHICNRRKESYEAVCGLANDLSIQEAAIVQLQHRSSV